MLHVSASGVINESWFPDSTCLRIDRIRSGKFELCEFPGSYKHTGNPFFANDRATTLHVHESRKVINEAHAFEQARLNSPLAAVYRRRIDEQWDAILESQGKNYHVSALVLIFCQLTCQPDLCGRVRTLSTSSRVWSGFLTNHFVPFR